MKQYKLHLKSLHLFCRSKMFKAYPAVNTTYWQFIAWRSLSVGFSVISATLAAIRMGHIILDIEPPKFDIRVNAMLKTLKKLSGAKAKKKLPVTPKILVLLIRKR